MAKKNETIAAGLNGLLAPTTSTPEESKQEFKTVCYYLPADIIERMRQVAYWDRKKINNVVVEAFTAYLDAWVPVEKKMPKKI